MKPIVQLLLFPATLLIFGCSAQEAYAQKICAKKKATVKETKKGKLKAKFSKALSVKDSCGKKEVELYDLSLQQGPQGETGAQGPTGEVGSNGIDGVDGQDAAWGDSSAGDVTFSSTTTLDQDNLQFNNFTVSSGVTLTVASGTIIRCKGQFNNDGTIFVTRAAATGREVGVDGPEVHPVAISPRAGISRNAASNGGLADSAGDMKGGLGGVGLGAANTAILKNIVRPPLYAGGGGGVGAGSDLTNSGGGAIGIFCEGQVTNNGSIAASGRNADEGDGGGAGGIVVIASATGVDSSSGTINVSGGNGGNSSSGEGAGGGGGGGLTHVIAPTIDLPSGNVDVSGGSAGVAGSMLTGSIYRSGGGGGASVGDGGDGGAIDPSKNPAAASTGDDGALVTRIVSDPAGML